MGGLRGHQTPQSLQSWAHLLDVDLLLGLGNWALSTQGPGIWHGEFPVLTTVVSLLDQNKSL